MLSLIVYHTPGCQPAIKSRGTDSPMGICRSASPRNLMPLRLAVVWRYTCDKLVNLGKQTGNLHSRVTGIVLSGFSKGVRIEFLI